MQFHLWQSTKHMSWFKDVLKHIAQKVAGMRGGVKRHLAWLMQIRQRTQIVDAEDVIGVSMGIEHGIELLDIFAQRLLAKIRSGIDEHVPPGIAEQHRRTSAAVPWIR